eukprot:3266251-Amphidinium_carterae.1
MGHSKHGIANAIPDTLSCMAEPAPRWLTWVRTPLHFRGVSLLSIPAEDPAIPFSLRIPPSRIFLVFSLMGRAWR